MNNMKNKYQMLKELLSNGITKKQIRDKNFKEQRFKINFANWNLSLFDFSRSNFYRSNFSRSNFSRSNFSESNFSESNFSRSNFSRSNFSGSEINEGTFGLTINCPEEGSFIGYKKASDKIVVLEIQSDAKRSSATTYKCRANKTKTLRIENLDGTNSDLTKISSSYDLSFIYEIGVINEVSNFDNDKRNECSAGIHFFMNRKMAECYN